ncbi:MAG TPA: hypothetical protein VGQ99_16875 [Tepidisphaeraceae bacterium]|jgi:hypothetical protein|nr:hypothetical protein [Tepidisphaeraceae bacterium]
MRYFPLILSLFFAAPLPAQQPPKYFKIQILDDQTNRGVPLVELTTTADVTYITDSNGLIALEDPALINQKVFFHIKSHGYEYPKDGFGFRGARLDITEGGSATLKIKRTNIAERLYRITGEGIYRDSILLGEKTPLKNPLLNAQVTGQDSVMAIPYRNKIYWFYGDTNRPSYPLGQFATSGAISELPTNGGLDPNLGIDLTYFTGNPGEKGFSRPMIAIDGPGVKWLTGIMTVPDQTGRQRLVARYDHRKGLAERIEHGLLLYNDEKEIFEKALAFKADAPLFPDAIPFKVSGSGTPAQHNDYYYFPGPYTLPLARVKATLKDVLNPDSYEGFVNSSWKAATKPTPIQTLIDFETGKPFAGAAVLGSVNWNPYRNRWIMIAQKGMDQTYYFEADTPIGPWVYGRRIVKYDHYTMYNVALHPFFNQENGRLIYFEGTYTREFSDAPVATPRYNYNQLMYRLDLSDPRLILPVPVYKIKDRYLLRDAIEKQNLWDKIDSIPFFAFDRPRDGLIPVYVGAALAAVPKGNQKPLFFALPKNTPDSPNLINLPAENPFARVWRNPQTVLILDTAARPPEP